MMSLELFAKIIHQVAPLTEQVTLHLMGDPLVHPRLADILKLCSEAAVPVFLVTNGVLLSKVREDLLLDPVIRQVNFSLHSFEDNFGDKDPSVYLEKIFSWTQRAFAQRPDLYINYRLWNLSEPMGVDLKNQTLLERVCDSFQVPIPRSLDIRRNKSYPLKNRLYLHFDTEFTWPALDLPILGNQGTCYGLSSHFGILADGTVVPCCLDKEGRIPLGDAQVQPIAEILNSTKAQAILQGFKNNKLTQDLCQRCNYIQRFQ